MLSPGSTRKRHLFRCSRCYLVTDARKQTSDCTGGLCRRVIDSLYGDRRLRISIAIYPRTLDSSILGLSIRSAKHWQLDCCCSDCNAHIGLCLLEFKDSLNTECGTKKTMTGTDEQCARLDIPKGEDIHHYSRLCKLDNKPAFI